MNNFYYLSDQEKVLAKSFYENESMREVVKKILLHSVYKNGVLEPDVKADGTQNWAYSLPWKQTADGKISSEAVSNEQLGAEVRAIAEGIRNIESVFQKVLPLFGSQVVKPETRKNPAR